MACAAEQLTVESWMEIIQQFWKELIRFTPQTTIENECHHGQRVKIERVCEWDVQSSTINTKSSGLISGVWTALFSLLGCYYDVLRLPRRKERERGGVAVVVENWLQLTQNNAQPVQWLLWRMRTKFWWTRAYRRAMVMWSTFSMSFERKWTVWCPISRELEHFRRCFKVQTDCKYMLEEELSVWWNVEVLSWSQSGNIYILSVIFWHISKSKADAVSPETVSKWPSRLSL